MSDLVTLPGRVLSPGRSRLRVGLGAAVVLVLVGLGVAVLVAALGGQGGSRVVPMSSPQSTLTRPSASATGATLFVHLLGAVAHPGLYQLRDGARTVDAIAAAGGFTVDADQGQVNLARPLSDGEQVVVPVIGAAPPLAVVPSGVPGGATAVNLNTADLAALDTLPGVGPSTAQRILDWRKENGRFTAIEDLLSVSGIGEKTFAELKDRITV